MSEFIAHREPRLPAPDDGNLQPFRVRVHWRDEYVGSGPYRVDYWQPGVEISYRAYEGFVFGKPKIDQIIIKFIGTKSNRDGIGARVRIGNQVNHMTSACGYASSSHFGVHFGLRKLEKIPFIEIKWPSGIVQVLEDVKANQILQVRESGK